MFRAIKVAAPPPEFVIDELKAAVKSMALNRCGAL